MGKILFVLGKMGSGKTTAIQQFLASGVRTFTETDSKKHLSLKLNRKAEVYSSYDFDGFKVAAAGTYDKQEPSRQGCDVFYFANTQELIAFYTFLTKTHDLVIIDGMDIRPSVIQGIKNDFSFIYFDSTDEQCFESRAARRSNRQSRSFDEQKLKKAFEKTEKHRQKLTDFGLAEMTVTRDTAVDGLNTVMAMRKRVIEITPSMWPVKS